MVIQYQIDTLLKSGVIIDDLSHFFIEGLLEIGTGTRIGSGVVITGLLYIAVLSFEWEMPPTPVHLNPDFLIGCPACSSGEGVHNH